MTYKLKFDRRQNYWVVTIKNGGSYHTPSLDDALSFIAQYHKGS